MTPKQKAVELVDKFKLSTGAHTKINIYVAKQCALIAVDEIISLDDFSVEGREYWQQVKQQIHKL